jgi:hypothetical protein
MQQFSSVPVPSLETGPPPAIGHGVASCPSATSEAPTCYDDLMAAYKDELFSLLRRLATVETSLNRIPLLPILQGVSGRRAELSRERSEIMTQLADKA